MTLTFRIPLLPPSVNSIWRKKARGGFYLSPEANAFINAVGMLAPKTPLHKVRGGLYDLGLTFALQKSEYLRWDLDNLIKVSADALTKCGMIQDDRYIVRIRAEKVAVETRDEEGVEYAVTGI